jgi:hypothetical protein
MRDSQFTCPSLFLASNIAFSRSVHSIEQVFIYTLNQSAEALLLAAAGLSYLGISYGVEILYVFDEVDLIDGQLEEELLAKRVTGSWSRFSANGGPEGGDPDSFEDWASAWGDNGWEEWLEKTRVMVIGGGDTGFSELGEGNGLALEAENLIERCGFLLSEMMIKEFRF